MLSGNFELILKIYTGTLMWATFLVCHFSWHDERDQTRVMLAYVLLNHQIELPKSDWCIRRAVGTKFRFCCGVA